MKKLNLIALAIFTLLLTACGGDTKTETPTTEVTEEVLITDVNTTVKTETQNDIINTDLATEQLTPPPTI